MKKYRYRTFCIELKAAGFAGAKDSYSFTPDGAPSAIRHPDGAAVRWGVSE